MITLADDRRIRRTKKALTNSLLELLKEKPLGKITVRELTQLADINRGTFYLHYKDILDLYCSIKNDFLNQLMEAVQPPFQTPYEYYLNLFCFLEQHTEAMLLFHQDTSFAGQIIAMLKKQHLDRWRKRFSNSNHRHYEYFYRYAAEGSIGIIRQWCQEEQRESPEVMAQILAKFTESGFALLNASDEEEHWKNSSALSRKKM